MSKVGSQAGLFETVVAGGYCIGCGACTALEGSSVRITLDEHGCFSATQSPDGEGGVAEALLRVCPFSSGARTEDEIGRDLFGDVARYDSHIGYHVATYAGYVAEDDFRERGSSGGLGKWILAELLREGLVDAVIQVVASPTSGADSMVYRYRVMDAVDDVRAGSKSVYYPVEMSDVLSYVRAHPGRYSITGVPCFIKAVRLLSEQEPVYKERIRFCVGLVCGHLKSARYADMIAWQFGIEPGDLAAIDFRKKLPGARANEKGVAVESRRDRAEVGAPDIVQHLFGTNYNHGFFQYRACDYCDDVVGETADISVGDAWLPEYLAEGRGTSVIVVRHPVVQRLMERAIEANRLMLQPLTVDRVVQSQAGGFRQRREGLAYRLHRADAQGVWRPEKRVRPRKWTIRRKRRRIYDLRTLLSERSHQAFRRAIAARDFAVFRREMEPLLEAYQGLYRPSFWHRVRRGLLRRVQRLLQKHSQAKDNGATP